MEKNSSLNKLKVWGGIECTINRIGREYKDQLNYSGHYDRDGDIELIAELGIQTIRYPVLWEKHQPTQHSKIDWSWSDRQLGGMRALKIKPIVGLLHHGSGPSFTNLLDPQFPYLLAAYAFEVANRYPWVEEYTPINEPLTTARFSGLYGLWYPHHKNELSFYRMLLNQLKGIVLAMQAIHSVNPSARLIQTEDLGKTHSTANLAYQAIFENERRLLTFDILTGRLIPGHPQYDYMIGTGIEKEDLDFFIDHAKVPDVIGLNYYVTSERWLDQSVEKYHSHTHGSNGFHSYADTEAVRGNLSAVWGFKRLAKEIWDRYQIPIAVTEVHLHCTREEQLRWFKQIWDEAIMLKDSGVTIKGVTAWALLGSFDWDTLLTKTGSQYESGAFDIKSHNGKPRPTALAGLLKTLAYHETLFHPVLSDSGWWYKEDQTVNKNSRPILILKDHALSTLFIEACTRRRLKTVVSYFSGEKNIELLNPWAIINLGNALVKHGTNCLNRDLIYVTFSETGPEHGCLKIILPGLSLTIHQVNKILDLMIDGEQGSWYIGADKDIIKIEENLHSRVFVTIIA